MRLHRAFYQHRTRQSIRLFCLEAEKLQADYTADHVTCNQKTQHFIPAEIKKTAVTDG